MRLFLTCSLLAISALRLPAQIANFQINAGSPEGLLLQLAGAETDETKKLALYDEFLTKYPKHEGAAYGLAAAHALIKAGRADLAVRRAQSLRTRDPNLTLAYTLESHALLDRGHPTNQQGARARG